jgi:hypothetical protein
LHLYINKKLYALLLRILTLLPIFGFFLLQCYVVDAAELKIAWDPPAETNPNDIGGYYFYWGNESRSYDYDFARRIKKGRLF